MPSLLCVMALVLVLASPFAVASAANPTGQWPHSIPARICDGANPDLFVMTLGPADTVLADGIYDPVADELTRKDGTVIRNYFRDTLGIKYYRPIDKTVFPLPPSGLCTWYYYYQDINENEVKQNADWIASNLRDYGARYVQIDDGWQGETAEGHHGSRDWTTIDKAFPGGMASLASYIKSRGLVPGIWIAPHGQSNETVVKKNPGVFLLKPDGTSASETWEGKYLLDPSAPAALRYLKELFTMLMNWGFEYFKIDGQPIVVDEYKAKSAFMKKSADGEGAYRKTIAAIRAVIGPSRYLLGCWGLPLEGMGYMDGSRTGGDVVLGWEGFFTALMPTMQYYFMHNIAWYNDPDVMLLRPPLTLNQARVWATLQGLTGQALFVSDRLADLSAERVELLRRVFPAVDIRPLDLFPAKRNKRIWDLKVNHLSRRYDIVGVFNFNEGQTDQVYLNWKELGIVAAGPVHVFDFWNREYFGAWEAGMAVELPPTSCRVLTFMPDNGQIQLLSTSRHITQGWVDLVRVERGPDSFRGSSRVCELEKADLTKLLAAGWRFPEPFQTIGRDGKTPIYGAIYRPSNFDPNRRYPVIDDIYNGPQYVQIPKFFFLWSGDPALAELGFVVVTVDGMGTAMRSKAFHNVSYRNLGDSGLPDHILALQQLAKKYPWLDLDRVGIYGHSAGGYDSAHAMLTHPEFYKVAVSSSGYHDNRSDKVWWNELWMDYPVGDHYKQQANPTLAANLRGKLLLVHGDLDDNVHPAATLQLVDALIKANKDFDLLIIPNRGHGLGNGYFVRKRWDYFVKNLLGVEPPHEYPLADTEPR